ncbi:MULTISPECIES: hypothetical protein [unclassified Wenzhouxiangella]|uniref:hypothetical protein n=1 Tax=unclassified Wenzhouxiangella TaxID=2613841 RepID=UPI0011C05144|nr:MULTISPECIES: hypothetical protein [unclassified Wenzhouxiangella]
MDSAEVTRVGPAGIYAFPGGTPTTGVSLLGAAVEPDQVTLTFPEYSVPETVAGSASISFPGPLR